MPPDFSLHIFARSLSWWSKLKAFAFRLKVVACVMPGKLKQKLNILPSDSLAAKMMSKWPRFFWIKSAGSSFPAMTDTAPWMVANDLCLRKQGQPLPI